ncbi:copper resistance protein CopC [Microbacterium sp. NPDC090007]|uniref:copper resistance CopC family protein n=1 Tax=Microbacterium sp. NPDC090007 TaxID=3364204 RepID=UPI0037F6AE9B
MLRLRAVVAGVVVAVFAVLASTVPASAHDELLSSSPAAGERLPSAPDEIALRFSADVLDMGAEVVVADADGTDWVAADPEISSGVVTVLLQGAMPDAGYEVRWRVVSSDGHPISGLIPFTVGDAAPLERAAASSDPAADSSAVAREQTTQIPRVVTVAAIGAGIALALFLTFFFFSRRRPSRRADS